MTARVPLRPMARILDARRRGADPDRIEKENLRQRHEELRDRLRIKAEQRLLIAIVLTILLFSGLGFRVTQLALTPVAEDPVNSHTDLVALRGDLLDRRGTVLATNLPTRSLYADPNLILNHVAAARALAGLFPDLDEDTLRARLAPDRSMVFLKDELSLAQQQAVNDIGDPGLKLGYREMRLYPNGPVAAHVLGAVQYGMKGTSGAELKGVDGVEAWFDAALSDPARQGAPIRLSLDLRLQVIMEEVLAAGMDRLGAVGAAAVLMDVETGEVLAMASLPDFDPNARPDKTPADDRGTGPLFNRAAQGVYELGSVVKTLTYAWALERGIVTPDMIIDTRAPLQIGPDKINDAGRHDTSMPAEQVLVESSNVGTARIARAADPDFMPEMLDAFGLLTPTGIELPKARAARSSLPDTLRPIRVATMSYGQGMHTSVLHIATAYAAIANGGRRVTPTLLADGGEGMGDRIVSEATARHVLNALRRVVVEDKGTANFARLPGYDIGGKTGTAKKYDPKTGRYFDDRYLNTFAQVFPVAEPKYVLVVTLDEPEYVRPAGVERYAGWTAVPVAAEITRRIAPVIGLRPSIEPRGELALTASGN